jgi:hypothetical protein
MTRRRAPASPQQGHTRQPSTNTNDACAANTTSLADNTRSVGTAVERLLTTREAANMLRLSMSWLAKARMRGDGPPFVKLRGSVLYLEGTLVRWVKSQQRLSTPISKGCPHKSTRA